MEGLLSKKERKEKSSQKGHSFCCCCRQYDNMGRMPNCLQPCCPLGGNLPFGNMISVRACDCKKKYYKVLAKVATYFKATLNFFLHN